MALSGYEKQKRWRAKHRALYNLQQRNRRKRGDAESTVCTGVPERENDRPTVPDAVGEIPTPATPSPKLPFETKKVGEFRMLVIPPKEAEERTTMPVVASSEALRGGGKPKVFFNDHGAQISERVWNDLQEKKREALESGYEFDPQ